MRLGSIAIVVASVGLVVMWSSGFVGAELAARAGGEPVTVLAWRFTVLSGLLGALVLPPFLTRLGVRHPLARGVAIASGRQSDQDAQRDQHGRRTISAHFGLLPKASQPAR